MASSCICTGGGPLLLVWATTTLAAAATAALLLGPCLVVGQAATQFSPVDVPQVVGNVSERLVYRSTGFMQFWKHRIVRVAVLQGVERAARTHSDGSGGVCCQFGSC